MSNEEVEEFDIPCCAQDEITKPGFVRVIVGIKGLKTSSSLIRKGFLPSFEKKADNATIEIMFEIRSLCLTVRGQKKGLSGQKYQLKIKQLPHEIDEDKSYHKVEDDRILLFLSKKIDKSWYPELESGLETAEEQSED